MGFKGLKWDPFGAAYLEMDKPARNRTIEIVEAVRGLATGSLILDGEALACRPDGRPQPFQVTMRRFGRKLEVERLRESIPIYPFFFDCLYIYFFIINFPVKFLHCIWILQRRHIPPVTFPPSVSLY